MAVGFDHHKLRWLFRKLGIILISNAKKKKNLLKTHTPNGQTPILMLPLQSPHHISTWNYHQIIKIVHDCWF